METQMKRLPRNSEELIGSPQIISRTVILDGRTITVRLQKPMQESYEDEDGVTIRYDTALVVESWSEATKSVVTFGITKNDDQTEQVFLFGARYMLNNSTDKEIAEVLRAKKMDQLFKFTTGTVEKKLMLPSPPKSDKAK